MGSVQFGQVERLLGNVLGTSRKHRGGACGAQGHRFRFLKSGARAAVPPTLERVVRRVLVERGAE